MEPTIPTTTISLSRKVNLGNYESADVFISINGITNETTEEDINALLDGPGAVAYKCIRTRLAEKVNLLKFHSKEPVPERRNEYGADPS